MYACSRRYDLSGRDGKMHLFVIKDNIIKGICVYVT